MVLDGCPNRDDPTPAGFMPCALVPAYMFPPLGTRGNPCGICRSQWRDGVTPTPETMPPLLLQLLGKPIERQSQAPDVKPTPVRRDPLASIRLTVAAPRAVPRRPPECDHSGRRLRPGPTCRTSVYACDIHGEATCDRCTGCEAFVPVGC